MPRVGEVRVDCEKLCRLLLVDCKLTKSGVETRLNRGATQITHSVLHRMLGGPKRSPARYANVTIGNVQAVLRLAREILKVSESELPLEHVLWVEDTVDGSQPALVTFDTLRESSIRAHRRAMADRHLAFRLYGQALCPLGPESSLVVTRHAVLKTLDEADTITTPVRRSGTDETFIRSAPMIVLGEEGVGKTWLVAQWWLSRHPDTLLLFLPGPRFRGAETDAARILAESLLALRDPNSLREGEDVWRGLPETDEFAAQAQHRVLIVVDGLNEAPDTNWQIVVETLWQTAVRWGARLILTSRPAYWGRRRRELDHWDCPAPAEVRIDGFDADELSRACALAGRDPDSIPPHLRERLCNPRIFRLAIRLLPSLRSEADLSIDRLLYAYWEQRQRDRPELAKLDPDRDVLLRGLARHAEEFHRRRVEAAQEQGRDLAADAVGYDLDDLHQRFPGLSRYGGLDAATASLLIGEIREGRFFDDDALVPSTSYVFRKESLAFALGLYLIQELTRTLRERRSRLTLDHLRERLAALLEPVLEFDQTADQVMAALTVACRDPDASDLVKAILLDQFLELRNRPPRMKAVLGGLAVEAPAVFCAAAERALDLGDPERIDTWLMAALGDMIAAGGGLGACGAWIVSPTEDEADLCGGAYAPVANNAQALAREKLAAMVLVGRALTPFVQALQHWALLVTAQRPFGRSGNAILPIAQTPIAQLIRFNDCDPEALTAALIDLESSLAPAPGSADAGAIGVLFALVGSPPAFARAETIWPGIAALTDPTDEQHGPGWQRALDPAAGQAELESLLREARQTARSADSDPYHPHSEALRTLAARCDGVLFVNLVRAGLRGLLDTSPTEDPGFSPGERLAWLAHDAASAMALSGELNRTTMVEMLGLAVSTGTRDPQRAADNAEQVLETVLAIAPENDHPALLFSAPPDCSQRNRPARRSWRPRMSGEFAVRTVIEACAGITSSETNRGDRCLRLLRIMSDYSFEPAPIDAIAPLLDSVLEPEPSLVAFGECLFAIAATLEGLGLSLFLLQSGWPVDHPPPYSFRIDAHLAATLAGIVPVGTIAGIVSHRALPAAADGVREDELAELSELIANFVRENPAAEPFVPTPAGARRILTSGLDWITAHLGFLREANVRHIEGLPPTINHFAAALLAVAREPISGAADYLATLLRLARIRWDESSRRLLEPTLAVALSDPARRRELLDLLILGITDDRLLAAVAQVARVTGATAVTMLKEYAADLAASGRTIRIAYALTLTAFLAEEAALSAYGQPADHYLDLIGTKMHRERMESDWALHWARQRLAERDAGAEYLALAFPASPLPGAADGLALPADANNLDRLFLHRFREKAAAWGGETLFGLPAPPKWLSARSAGKRS